MDKIPLGPAEAAEIPQLVRSSADKVVTALSHKVDFEQRYALGDLATALAITEGLDKAHQFAANTIETLKMRPADECGVWSDLYKAGDMLALPKARRAIGLASEQTTFLEELGVVQLGGLHSAERLVQLVEAGAAEMTGLARDMTKHVYVTERAALFGQLYRAGDAASLDLAINAAKDAKVYIERTRSNVPYPSGDDYYRSERALKEMADHALKAGQIGSVLSLMNHLENESSKADLHAELYRHGRTESLQKVLDYLQTVPSKYYAEPLERKLAQAGYAPALEAVKQRAMPRKKLGLKLRFGRKQPANLDTYSRLEDLITLHEAGVPGAAKLVAETVKADKEPEFYLRSLGRVGLSSQEIELAAKLYKQDPSVVNAERLYTVQPTNQLWKTIFHQWLYDRDDVWQAAGYVNVLAGRLKTKPQ